MIAIVNSNIIGGLPANLSGGGAVLPFSIVVDTSKSAGDGFSLPIDNDPAQDGTIDWGDSSSSDLSYANRAHTYASGGIYTITITGNVLKGFNFGGSGDYLKITDISQWGILDITSGSNAFKDCANLTITATDAPTISATTFYRMFYNCDKITTPDFSNWDTSTVTNMQEVFRNSLLFNGNLAGWVTSSTTTIRGMFMSAVAFNQDLSSWDVSGVTTMYEAFKDADGFNSSVAGWAFKSGVSLYATFQNAEGFTGIGVDSWNTSNVTNTNRVFNSADSFNGDISNWDTSNFTDIQYMLNQCDDFRGSLAGWDITGPMTNMNTFMNGATGMSTANYDATLIAWDAQGTVGYSGTVNFGGSKYTAGGAAEAARTSLITKFGGISDGGAA